MASRGPFGFRAKPPDTEDARGTAIPVGMSRRSSITSTGSKTSKLPTHAASSFFSRNKQPKPRGEPSPAMMHLASNLPIGRGQTSVNITSTNPLPKLQPKTEPSKTAGLGISMEKKTAQVNKAGKTRNVLRRKAPTIDSRSGYARTESSASSYDPAPPRQTLETKSSPEARSDPFPNQVLGITPPSISSSSVASKSLALGPSFEFDTSSSRMARYNSRKTPSPAPHPAGASVTPGYTQDSSSSTRCSDSPSGLSYSSTPTSMTSASPGISTPVSIPSVRSASKPLVPSRPPVAWANKRRQGLEPSSQGLAAVRESGTSSSSSSTVKASGSRDETGRNVRATRSSPPVPASPTAASPNRRLLRNENASPEGSHTTRFRAGHTSPTESRVPLASSRRAESPGMQSAPARGNTPPMRPSRDGVPSLDMKKLNLDFTVPRSAPVTLNRSTSNVSSRAHHPRLAASPDITAGKAVKTADAPIVETNIASVRAGKDPSPRSATSSKSTSRFNLFSRRTRSPMETSANDQQDKTLRKGPAAGTGHEGYGKYARRGRSGSMSTSASRGRSTSSNSVGRTPSSRKSSLTSRDEEQMDDFYRSRLEPRKIVGGGHSGANSAQGSEVYLSETAQSSASALSRTSTSASPYTTYKSEEPSRTHTLRHVGQRLPRRDGSFEVNPAKGSVEASTPTLATRRSIHRSQLPIGAEPVRIPAPIDTRATAPSPALDSQNTYQSSAPPSESTVPLTDDISEGHEGNWLKSGPKDKPAKSPKKWAFFHRAQASPKKNLSAVQPSLDRPAPGLRAQVSRLPESRNLAYYELMNPNEQNPSESVRMDGSRPSHHLGPPIPVRAMPSEVQPFVENERQQKLSVLLPSPPVIPDEFPDLPARPPMPTALADTKPSASAIDPGEPQSQSQPQPQTQTAPRRPRLQQIGRIPRVVSKRDRQHNPPPLSFSRPRPYTPKQDQTSQPPSSAPLLAESTQPSAGDRPVLGLRTGDDLSADGDIQDSAKPASAPAGSAERGTKASSGDEFLIFPPRIGSEVSGSSSSGNLSVVDITAIVPRPGTAPTEEEEWNEYNDFLDIMESPVPLAGQKGDSKEKSTKAPGWAPAPLEIRKGSSSGSSRGSATQQTPQYPLATPPNRKLPSPPKRSRDGTASPSKEVPSDSVRDTRKDERLLSPPQRKSLAASSRYSTSSIESEADSLANLENVPRVRVDVPNHLRLELLTTSKLLSFDRVLFSPAQAEVLGNKKSRVLVLDGLGVDDWAFFCAQEYPEAQISNLSATPRTAVAAKNYDHHHYPTLDDPFPFPQNYFTAAVLRFPAANTEHAYGNVIKEFRRVLCPNGYLEITILDLDMVKMGSETRKALRTLKEWKQITDPQISLKPLSDNIQKMLGGKAFENLKQCMLEIPVASQTESARVRSFNERMELLDEMPQDEDRTRHLPEIGRWWFSRCYEASRIRTTTTPKSIWEDKSVLEECKSMETGFKLLLCYAQKPHKRRTLSL